MLRNVPRLNALFTALAFVVLGSGCKKENKTEESRSFYMAVTPWPADFTVAAVDDAYRFINNHCDAVSHHFDEGVPYEEAYRNLPWPSALREEIARRKEKTQPGKVVFLSVAPLNLTRKEKADYYRETTDVPDSIQQHWKMLPINHPSVITAYTRFMGYLMDELQPRFVNFGVESNEVGWDATGFTQYKEFLAAVHNGLKTKYPSLPFFISFMVSDHPASLSLAAQLLPYTDYVSLSAYPYIHALTTADGITDPERFPADYFTRFLDLAPDKPWGFAETGYIAEDLVIPTYSLNKKGTEEWQKDYLQLVCELSERRKAQFLIWFCSSDYDAGNNRLKAVGLYQDLFGLWEDTGLRDENGRQRPACATWLQWMRRKKK